MTHYQQEPDKNVPIDSQASGEDPKTPASGNKLRTTQRIKDALAATPGGAELDEYFGITTGDPQQPEEEAEESEELLNRLRTIGNEDTASLEALMDNIARHVDGSEVDPEALRALMRGPSRDTKSRGEG